MDKITAKADMDAAWTAFRIEWRKLDRIATGTPEWITQYDKCTALRREGDKKTTRYQNILRREWIVKQYGTDLD